MVNIMKTSAIALAVLVLAACGSSESKVPWENYHPEVKERIETMHAAGNCAGLQVEFDTAYDNDAAQRARTGTGNSHLLNYIFDLQEDAGCFEQTG